ncbi:MAG: formate--tetrahydrofolate ligase [Nitrospiraceae bacterium]|nr:formate--tetrahydrofolate ligase [Nitrospiraceae bacterium]
MTQSSINLDIASRATLRPIMDVAQQSLGLDPNRIELFGKNKAKIPLSIREALKEKPDGKLILVTAISPTKAGEGKTTTSIGLADGLNYIGAKALVAIREPSLGPCFGMKGGACGGGYAQVAPMADINLHFTGDFHAITAAHNLLAAMVDNHLYWGHKPLIDPRRVTWGRVLDVNDRSLRSVVTGIGGKSNGFTREGRFDITAASEVMAILCLAADLKDLERRLGNIKVGRTAEKDMVFAKDIKAEGAMTVLLKEALNPNLVQTLENNPALVHGGPFGNIAHGCNSIVATKLALKLAEYVVTEAGFGADLGAEKFFNIKCRKAGLKPACAVVVATIKALKLHGGGLETQLTREDLPALKQGLPNLLRHLANVKKFGVPAVVAINQFTSDTPAELDLVKQACQEMGVRMVVSTHWADGGKGAAELAETVKQLADSGQSQFTPLYPDAMPLAEKMRTIACEVYGADDVAIPQTVQARLTELEKNGYGHFPVCMAKTQYSFSTDPALKGAPSGFTVPVREVRLAMGAEFVVAITGDIMTMPGLPRVPAAEAIGLDEYGHISGLF